MEQTTSIQFKLEGSAHFELSSPTEENDDKIYELSREGYSHTVNIPKLNMNYPIQVPAFGKSHILVRTQDSKESMIVYGVECGEGVQMSCNQIVNRVREVFGVVVSENITANRAPDNETGQSSNGEAMYSCGTLFISGRPCSTSSSLDISPPSHRPDCLQLARGTLPPIQNTPTLITPRPVATPNTILPHHAIVACNGNFNIPGDPCKETFDDSMPAFTEEGAPAYREGMVKVPTLMQNVLGPVQKIQGGNAELTNQLGVVALDTPEQNTTFLEHLQPKVQITVQNEDNSTTNKTPIPHGIETSSEESEQYLSSQPEHGASLVASVFDKKSTFGNQLVVGIGMRPRRKLSMNSLEPTLDRPVLNRQSSLPGKKITQALSIQRNASDDCLERLEIKPQHDRSASDLLLKFDEEPEPSEKVGPSPATPTKPLAVEREDSVASPELVMIKNSRVPFHSNNQVQDDDEKSVPPEPQKVIVEQQQSVNVSNLNENKSTDESSPAPVTTTKSSSLTTPPEVSPIASPISITGSSLTTSSDSSPGTESPSSDFMQQVHLLEHAMNGYCRNQSACSMTSENNDEFTQAVEQMKSLVQQAFSDQDEHIKSLIRGHCRHCRDKECKVPHRMAGCLPAAEWNSQTEQTDSPTPYTHTPSSSQKSPATFDKQANLSTSTEVEKYYKNCTHAQPSDDFIDNNQVQDQTGPFPPQHLLYGHPPHLAPLRPSYVTSPSAFKQKQLSDQRVPQPSDCGSPVDSEGFSMPGEHMQRLPVPMPGTPLAIGQQYQESQAPANSYLHQATGKGKGELRGRRLYSYIEPSRSGGSLRKMYGGTEHKVKGAKPGEFPSYSSLPRKPGTLIYSLKENELVPGEVYPCPHNVHSERDRLGRGGNGTVVKFPLGGTVYALKQTTYRENELNIWSKLNHPNILPLLGVMLGEQQRDCFQFMPKMTGDLRSMLFDQGDLLSLLQKHPEQWGLVMSNSVYILEEILSGLIYLESENVQHSDLKANNVLILRKCACPDILHCQCPKQEKCEVKLADFDSLKKTKYKRSAAQFMKLCSDSLMNDIERNNVKGTPAYRAPEQFLSASNRGDYKKVLQDGKIQHDLEGPWCDIWSLGVVVLQMVLGSHSKGPYISEASMLASCKADKMQPRIEAPVATIRLVQLQDLSAHNHPELKPFAKLARECLKIDCRTRPTAKELLELLQAHTLNC